MEDQRFKSVTDDLRCRRVPKNVRKVKIDKRFQKMFKSKQFKEGGKIDERGRKLDFSTTDNLKKLYNYNDSSEDNSSESSENEQNDEKNNNLSNLKKREQMKKKNVLQNNKSSFTSENVKKSNIDKELSENDDVDHVENVKNEKYKNKFSDDLSDKEQEEENEDETEESDESDSGDEDPFVEPEEFDHQWEEWHEQAPDTDKITRRLALCNMDWDRIRADDLLTVFNSFKPDGGTINSVKIYPSDFGLKRMAEERLKGPEELVQETLDPDEEEVVDKKLAKFHREKLRQYQLKRLMYYYAVIDCDSPETADHLYEELNGKEYESSSVRIDLRFIPDDVTFDHDPVSDAVKVVDPSQYKPRLFVSTALGQAKVNLTWDETDPHRKEIIQKAFTEPENIENDIKHYLASSSGESEEELEEPEDKEMRTSERISKYKELLQSFEEKDKDEENEYEMEITWEPGLKEKTEKLVKQKLEKADNPFDEKRKKKREERKLKMLKKAEPDNNEESASSESEENESDDLLDEKPAENENTKNINELALMSEKSTTDQLEESKSKKKKMKKKKKQLKKETNETKEFQFIQDSRFSALFTSADFNVDPSDPHFKKTDASMAIIQEKQKRFKVLPYDKNKRFKKARFN
ncbi:ESF1 homolog [Caerostris extrusa]|uniref:ESF1 homolog n=1 Tax=Caerostris extrusa TaxID=172846 RepID=A0AAV4QNT8_CAEEX|nr:ESF1 homolog [Caerostris extrusa]